MAVAHPGLGHDPSDPGASRRTDRAYDQPDGRRSDPNPTEAMALTSQPTTKEMRFDLEDEAQKQTPPFAKGGVCFFHSR